MAGLGDPELTLAAGSDHLGRYPRSGPFASPPTGRSAPSPASSGRSRTTLDKLPSVTAVRSEIAQAWRLAELHGLYPGTRICPPVAAEPVPSSRLTVAVAPVLDRLASDLSGVPSADRPSMAGQST